MNELVPEGRYKTFVDNIFSGMELQEAGKKAGFGNPSRDAIPILYEPATRAYFKKRIQGRHQTEGIAIAYKFMIDCIRNERLDTKVRLDAAKFVYGNALPAPKAAEPDQGKDKDLAEMSKEELHQFIEKTQDELANRAIPVNNRPQAVEDLL